VVLPGPGVPSSVAHAFLEGVRFGLGRLAVALGRSQPATLGPLAARFRLSCTARRDAAEELSAWPADIRALAAPLYAAGLPAHCLPGPSQATGKGTTGHTRLDATTDLRKEVPRHTFLALSAQVLASVGDSTGGGAVEVDGLGGHGFRHGRALELFHGNASREAVTDALPGRGLHPALHHRRDLPRLARGGSVGRGGDRQQAIRGWC
jgi:hypothetical protein